MNQNKIIEHSNSGLVSPVERQSVALADSLTHGDNTLLKTIFVTPDLLPASFKGPGDSDCEITDSCQKAAIDFRKLERVNRAAWGFK